MADVLGDCGCLDPMGAGGRELRGECFVFPFICVWGEHYLGVRWMLLNALHCCSTPYTAARRLILLLDALYGSILFTARTPSLSLSASAHFFVRGVSTIWAARVPLYAARL